MMKNEIKLFNDKKVRTHWDTEKEEWYFSVVDVCNVLSMSKSNDSTYWRKIKQRLKEDGSELVTNCHTLKMRAEDGKMRETDVLDTKGILRLVQSIPSPNAEPFKVWLANVGNERLNEIADPEKAIHRALNTYKKEGYTERWIEQRLQSIDVRKNLEAEWQRSDINEPIEYAILTDEITKAWSGFTTKEYKQYKGLKKESLRDNMSTMELILNMLGEEATTTISKQRNPHGLEESKQIAREGGSVANVAKKQLELSTGKKVITSLNFKKVKALLDKKEDTEN